MYANKTEEQLREIMATMTPSELVAMLCAKEDEEHQATRKQKKVRAPPPPPPPYEKVTAVFDPADEESNVECIVEADFLEYVEGLDKAGLKKTISNLVEDLKHLSGWCVADDVTVISFRDEMVRKKKRGGGGGAGAGLPRKAVEPFNGQCESAVWDGGKGSRCNSKGDIMTSDRCDRLVCKSHEKAIKEFAEIMEVNHEEGHLIGWYDSFDRKRHDQYSTAYKKARKARRASPVETSVVLPEPVVVADEKADPEPVVVVEKKPKKTRKTKKQKEEEKQ